MADAKLEVQGKIKAIAGTGKAILLENGDAWYSAYKPSELTGFVKGDEVKITYIKKGAFCNIKSIEKIAVTPAPAPVATPATAPTGDIDLGKGTPLPPLPEFGDSYSRQKDARIMRESALKSAASITAAAGLQEPKAAGQHALILAEMFLNWLKLA